MQDPKLCDYILNKTCRCHRGRYLDSGAAWHGFVSSDTDGQQTPAVTALQRTWSKFHSQRAQESTSPLPIFLPVSCIRPDPNFAWSTVYRDWAGLGTRGLNVRGLYMILTFNMIDRFTYHSFNSLLYIYKETNTLRN